MILIALGSNVTGPWGPPRETLLRALSEMQRHNIEILVCSTVIETPPMGPQDQPNYVNAVAVVRTAKSPDSLMRTLHGIEKQAGRVRRRRWGPRTLDLDLLDYHGQHRTPPRRNLARLTLPHPGIAQRSFVLGPITEIAPRWRHPLMHQTADLMLRKLRRLNQG